MGLAASSFFLSPSVLALTVLTIAVLISRIGLWLFDLCARQICQETIQEKVRGSVNSTWLSITNVFELSAYALTIILSQPSQFVYLSLMSFLMVLSACIMFLFSSVKNNKYDPIFDEDRVKKDVITSGPQLAIE